jgi:uncharacterized membrane protein
VGTDDTRSRATGYYERDTVEFARGVAFFDAVYAFALTLLVVNLDPPDAEDWASLTTFFTSGIEWQLLGFAISFAVIAVFWRVNHRLVALFRALSPATIVANLVATAFVVLIPFSTQGISDVETADEPLTIAVYAVNISCAILAQSAMFWVAVFLASIPIAYAFGADWARLTWALLIVLGPLSGRIASRRVARILAEERGSESQNFLDANR